METSTEKLLESIMDNRSVTDTNLDLIIDDAPDVSDIVESILSEEPVDELRETV